MSIPKIIHHIWIGGPLPEKYRKTTESIRELNPEYEQKIWLLEDFLADERLDGFTKRRIEELANTDSVADRVFASDILRPYVVHAYGGWYFDVDFIPYRGLSELKIPEGVAFVASMVRPSLRHRYANAVFAALKGCPICLKIFEASKKEKVQVLVPLFSWLVTELMDEKSLVLNYHFFLPDAREQITQDTIMYHTSDLNWKEKKRGDQTIPRVIHHIWIGGELPEKYRKNIETIAAHNPDFEQKIWLLEDFLQEEKLDHQIKKRVVDLTKSGVVAHRVYASNIMRCYLLHEYGGWYLDVDFVSYRGIGNLEIPKKCDFVVSQVHPMFRHRYSSSMMASGKGHFIMKKLFDLLKEQKPKAMVLLFCQVVTEYMDTRTLILSWHFFSPHTAENVTDKTIMLHTADSNWKDDKDYNEGVTLLKPVD